MSNTGERTTAQLQNHIQNLQMSLQQLQEAIDTGENAVQNIDTAWRNS